MRVSHAHNYAFTLHSQTGAVETVLDIGKHVNTMLYLQVSYIHTYVLAYIHTYIHTCIHTYIHTQKVEVSSSLAVALKQPF